MSAAGHGRLARSASSIVAKPADGFHLFRIDGYSHTKTVLPGQKLSSQPFAIGGHSWQIDYYPNGRDSSAKSNAAISFYLQLVDYTQLPLQARYKFSLLDHDGIAAYELPAETGTFTSVPPQVSPYHNQVHHNGEMGTLSGKEPGPGCGHDEFIGRDEQERREHLIRHDSILVRCDVGVMQIDASWLAQEELDEDDEDSEEEDMYEAPGFSARRRRRHRRRADDGQYVKWCLAQRPGGGRR